MKLSKNFDLKEFTGKNKEGISLFGVEYLQRRRDEAGEPVTVHSTKYHFDGMFTVTFSVGKKAPEELGHIGFSSIPVFGTNPPVELPLSFKELRDLSLRDVTVLTAMLQTGYKEGINNSTPFNRDMGYDNVPWCAVFCHWCVRVSHMFLRQPVPFDYSTAHSNSRYTLNHGLHISVHPADIEPGDFLVWGNKGNNVTGHTALCVYNDTAAETLFLVEGNLNNKVAFTKRKYRGLNTRYAEFLGAASYLPSGGFSGEILPNGVAGVVTGNESTV